MPKFTALIHADSTVGLEETLQSASVANDLLVICDGSEEILDLCRRYHARAKVQIPGVTPGAYAMDAFHHWILILRPGEVLSPELREKMAEWRNNKFDECAGYRIETADGKPEEGMRFVNRRMINWIGEIPAIPTQIGQFPGRLETYQESRAA